MSGDRKTEQLRWFGRTLSKDFKRIKIVPWADWHYNNPFFSQKHLDRDTDMIASDPEMFAVLDGDLCESALKTSKGDIYRVASPQEQRDWVIKKLMPIKHKLLGMTTGNHENRIYNETGIDISADIAKALGIPYRPEGIWLKISFGSGNDHHPDRPYTYWLYATHGYGGARTKSAKAVKVERLGTWIDADVYIMSHDHVVNVAPDIYLKHDNRGKADIDTGFVTGAAIAQRKMLVKTSAYLKWGGYSEQGGFPPTDLSLPIIVLAGEGKPRVSVIV